MNKPILKTKNLAISLFGTPILKAVSFSVKKGSYLSIIGANGAGKTTLIKSLAGIYSPPANQIEINQQPLESYSAKQRARIYSYVPQADGRTIPLTVFEFIALGRYPHLTAFTSLTSHDYEAIHNAIRTAKLEPLQKRSMNTLSGGERQMAFIAAALAQETPIMLLDEPTTFLDYHHQNEVHQLLQTACKTKQLTIIAVHHDLNTALQQSDQIIALKKGKLIFDGTPQELTNLQTLEKIYDTPFQSITGTNPELPFIFSGGRS